MEDESDLHVVFGIIHFPFINYPLSTVLQKLREHLTLLLLLLLLLILKKIFLIVWTASVKK